MEGLTRSSHNAQHGHEHTHTHIHTYREREGERERGEGEGRGTRHVRMVYTHEEKATCRITLIKTKKNREQRDLLNFCLFYFTFSHATHC